ncbi:MAG: UDP-N-acetylmuramoyl-L-alanyl-D-glutamate--2,6-diaminopimelate ligase, partial [Calditrichaeota bacterium]
MMILKDLLQKIDHESVSGDVDRLVSDIHYHSDTVEKDSLFVAIRGYQTDGHRFISNAFENGARVFMIEKDIDIPGATVVRVADTRKALSRISRVFFGYPDRKLKIIGITGTTGKTTTAYLIHSILTAAHWNPGLISTVESYDGDVWKLSERTTPEALDIFRLFHQMNRKRLKSAVMEVSSHALSLYRVKDISFTAGVFTNLGRDHLDFHKTMDDYFLAKKKLFDEMNENQRAILNIDDLYSTRIQESTGGEVFTYSMNRRDATVCFLHHESRQKGMSVTMQIPSGVITLETSLLGDFNIYNILAAVTTAVSLGIQDDFIIKGVESLKRIPGRCEILETPSNFTVYVDYAHTPESLHNILRAVWGAKPATLIVVFGAGGDRDRGKRPAMGKAADDFADKIILTNDNPRSEDPETIIKDILEGISDKSKVSVIIDRREAIQKALDMAQANDGVLIAGKGHET